MVERGRQLGWSLPHLPSLALSHLPTLTFSGGPSLTVSGRPSPPLKDRPARRQGGLLPATCIFSLLPLLSPLPKPGLPPKPKWSRLVLVNLNRFHSLNLCHRILILHFIITIIIIITRHILVPLLPPALPILPTPLPGLGQDRQKCQGVLTSRELTGD